jgi:DNA-binding NarL/FixJ family response regulator
LRFPRATIDPYWSNAMHRTPVRRLARPPRFRRQLSPREVEVLRLIAAGRRDRAIALDLRISPRTVTTHVSSILAKLGAENRAAAAALAVRLGLA